MTITAIRTFQPSEGARPTGRVSPKPLRQIWSVSNPPFQGHQPPPSEGYQQSDNNTAIIIDNGDLNHIQYMRDKRSRAATGSSLLRAGWAFDQVPRLTFPANVARFRDRKLGRTCVYCGWDAYADATTRGQIRNAFEPGTGIVANWDIMEGVLDYTFLKLGIDGEEGGIGRPILMTEAVANLGYSRRSMSSSGI